MFINKVVVFFIKNYLQGLGGVEVTDWPPTSGVQLRILCGIHIVVGSDLPMPSSLQCRILTSLVFPAHKTTNPVITYTMCLKWC